MMQRASESRWGAAIGEIGGRWGNFARRDGVIFTRRGVEDMRSEECVQTRVIAVGSCTRAVVQMERHDTGGAWRGEPKVAVPLYSLVPRSRV
jgi:hypothetical protein